MATQAQVQANRMNAQKSTGPRTADGKAIASQNALKHGLCAEKAVIAGEDVGEFEFYRDELLGDLAPAGAVEAVLAERVVSLSWRLRRAERAQNEAFDALLAKDIDYPVPRLRRSLPTKNDSDTPVEETPLGRAVVRDFTHARALERLSMYERRIEYSLYKTMGEFRKLRQMREAELGTEKPARAGERWGKPHPTPAAEEPARADERWGKPHPTCAAEEPARADERWGEPHPPFVAEAAGGNGERVRQTKPISGDADGPGRAQTAPCGAKQSQFADPAGATPGADRAKQTQSATPPANLSWQKGVCQRTPGMQNKPNSPGRGCAAHGCAGHIEHPVGP